MVSVFVSASVQASFLQTDPIGYQDDLNLYTYVANDPLNKVDPLGLEGSCVVANNCANVVITPQSIGTAADFTPGVNDVKGVVDAVRNPSAVNIAAALIGLVPGAGDVAAKSLKTGSNILENAAKGAKAEAEVASRLGNDVAGKRVTLESTTGKRSVADIVTKDKGVREVKAGGGRLSSGQKAVKADIDAGRKVTPRGQNAKDAGLDPGRPTEMKCYTVDRCP